jgi:hypothetical protein
MPDVRITRIRINGKLINLSNPTKEELELVRRYALEDRRLHSEIKHRIKETLKMAG